MKQATATFQHQTQTSHVQSLRNHALSPLSFRQDGTMLYDLNQYGTRLIGLGSRARGTT